MYTKEHFPQDLAPRGERWLLLYDSSRRRPWPVCSDFISAHS
jgi:hypothetical protein